MILFPPLNGWRPPAHPGRGSPSGHPPRCAVTSFGNARARSREICGALVIASTYLSLILRFGIEVRITSRTEASDSEAESMVLHHLFPPVGTCEHMAASHSGASKTFRALPDTWLMNGKYRGIGIRYYWVVTPNFSLGNSNFLISSRLASLRRKKIILYLST